MRRALGFDLEISVGSDRRHRDAHYRVYAESVRNLGTPVFPRALFEAALDQFGDEADIVIVWQDGRPLAGLLNFYLDGTCQPYLGRRHLGGARRCRANDLIYYALMRHAIARGCTRADFGRSKVGTGPWSRKRIWGFEREPAHLCGPHRGRRRAAPGQPARSQISPQDRRLAAPAACGSPTALGPLIARGLG